MKTATISPSRNVSMPSPGDVTLEARHLVCSFGTGSLTTFALRGVNVRVRAGEIECLIGPSGSGKSTLVAILSGLLRPDEGTVRALGEDLWAMSEREREEFRRRSCGFIFQGYNLFPALTAMEQLELVLKWGSGVNGAIARRMALETLDQLGLADRAHLRPQALSGGEKQRVAIGRALVKKPSLLFADEPTAALDWKHGEQVVNLLRQAAHEQNATVVLVSHDPRIIPLSDQVRHLVDGRIVEAYDVDGVHDHDVVGK